MQKYTIYTIPAMLFYDCADSADYKAIGGYSVFENIQIERLNKFGASSTDKQIMDLRKEIVNYQLEFAKTDDSINKVFIIEAQKKLQRLMDSFPKKSNFGESCAMLRKNGMFQFNSAEITLFDYLSNISVYEKSVKNA